MTPEGIRGALAAHHPVEVPALPGRTNHLRGGVLVPLCWEPDPVVILTERSQRLSRHRGEVCFPGGKPEPGDADLCATALREAEEELGITGADVLGRLSSMPVYTSDYRLEPFVAAVDGAGLRPNPDEVADVIRIPLIAAFEAEAIDAIPWSWEGRSHMSPIFDLGGRILFGATAHTYVELLQVLASAFGLNLPRYRAGGWSWDPARGRPVRV